MLSSVQRPASGPRAPLTSGQRWFGIALVLIVSLGWLFPFVLSQVLSMHGMEADHAWRVAFRVSGVIACVIVLVLAYGRANDTEANREIRRARTSEKALRKQSFKCVAPQVPGKFVVFPVRVVRRGVDASTIVSVEADEVRVELDTRKRDADGAIDSEGSLRRLLEARLAPALANASIVTFQGRDSGPTGLSAGLAIDGPPDFDLGRKVACALMDAAGGVK